MISFDNTEKEKGSLSKDSKKKTDLSMKTKRMKKKKEKNPRWKSIER